MFTAGLQNPIGTAMMPELQSKPGGHSPVAFTDAGRQYDPAGHGMHLKQRTTNCTKRTQQHGKTSHEMNENGSA